MDQWLSMPAAPELGDGDVHVWSASINQSQGTFDYFRSLLLPAELERLERYRDWQARSQFAVGRGVLRHVLGNYLDRDPTSLVFTYGDRGKPALCPDTSRTEVEFNLSHSGAVVLIAFSWRRQLGIDVEQILSMHDLDAIADHFFTREEALAVKNKQAGKRELFYRIWTRKEAVLKCTGRGIDDDCKSGNPRFSGVVRDLSPGVGYMAALAVQGSPFSLTMYRWDNRSGELPTPLESGSPMAAN